MDIERALADLEQDIAKLKRDFDRFLAGAEKVSPERERDRVLAEIKQLNSMTMQNSGQRFLFQSLMTRFYSYNELWNRLLRAKEEGIAAAAASAAAALHRPQHMDAANAMRVDAWVLGSTKDAAPVGELYQKFLDVRSETGETTQKVSEKAFHQLVLAQYQQLSNKYGTDRIEFKVAVKDGKVQLKAKPLGTK
ncbi:MAG: hypothetical protein HYX75_07320 [Acidobacteria bacterium]|nr:hypothetical protein [Acidobacteriota bacterium]